MEVPCLTWSRAFDSSQVHESCFASTGHEISTVTSSVGVPNPFGSLGTSKLVLFNVDNYIYQCLPIVTKISILNKVAVFEIVQSVEMVSPKDTDIRLL
jgi:hypothetical protein